MVSVVIIFDNSYGFYGIKLWTDENNQVESQGQTFSVALYNNHKIYIYPMNVIVSFEILSFK